jgi:hypothetical protein
MPRRVVVIKCFQRRSFAWAIMGLQLRIHGVGEH